MTDEEELAATIEAAADDLREGNPARALAWLASLERRLAVPSCVTHARGLAKGATELALEVLDGSAPGLESSKDHGPPRTARTQRALTLSLTASTLPLS